MLKKQCKIRKPFCFKGKWAKTAPKTAPKGCEKRVFRAFLTEYLYKNAKKKGIYATFLA